MKMGIEARYNLMRVFDRHLGNNGFPTAWASRDMALQCPVSKSIH
ncbi:hypothetical protein ROLI_028540 [Roseobacter fucihabitans]|uniref:Uncharacterized protein n=1 Tax=Roseobacter fucihabitans TaxID=1537242 RepID=A0ABZ2BUR4_9RHOB|nr:hypothetical protein [Roseobacter litoralis]